MKRLFIIFVTIATLLNITFAYAEENYGFEEFETYLFDSIPMTVDVYQKSEIYTLGEMKLSSALDCETSDFPSAYNNKIDNLQFVSPVKHQKESGNCWIFSALGAAESYMLKYFPVLDENGKPKNDAYDFSENYMQYMVSNKYNNTKFGHNIELGSGGDFGKVIPYFLNRVGLVNEIDDRFIWPATGRDYSETANIPLSDYIVTGALFNHEDFSDYDGRDYDKKENLKNQIKQIVMSYGSAVCSVNATGYFAEEEKKHLYYFPASETASVVASNHSVLIVGWDDNYDKENFRHGVGENEIVPPENGAFIVKNSWGTDVCDNGFFYLSYYDYYVGYDLFAITEMQKRDENELLYLYDEFFPYGGMGFNLKDGNGNIFPATALMYGNQFERKTDNEILTEVSLYADKGSIYDIYIINDELEEGYNAGGEKVVRFPQMSTKTTKIYNSFVPGYDGYYTLDVTDTKITSEKFSIMVVGGDIDGGYQYLPIESNASSAEVTNATQQKLQSFYYFYFEDYPEFMYDYYGTIQYLDKNNQIQTIYGNAPVKAITKTQEKSTDISFINYTNINKEEKTTFNKGDTVRIAAVVDGANLAGATLICGIYNGNKLIKVLDKEMGNKQNVFVYEEIPADFENYTVRVFAIDAYDNIKPLGNVLLK